MLEEVFGPVISEYTRRQAIEDGVLVQLSGVGYEGDEWVPQAVKEAGFRDQIDGEGRAVPMSVCMTATSFAKYVTPIEGDGEKLAPCQDAKGRLWDVLWMLRVAIKACREETDTLYYSLYVVPNVPEDHGTATPRAKKVRLKSVCGPDDDGTPCMTIMLPDED